MWGTCHHILPQYHTATIVPLNVSSSRCVAASRETPHTPDLVGNHANFRMNLSNHNCINYDSINSQLATPVANHKRGNFHQHAYSVETHKAQPGHCEMSVPSTSYNLQKMRLHLSSTQRAISSVVLALLAAHACTFPISYIRNWIVGRPGNKAVCQASIDHAPSHACTAKLLDNDNQVLCIWYTFPLHFVATTIL